MRGLTDRTARTPALCFSAAILLWGAGNVAWWLVVRTAKNPPYPSVGDLGYLLFYPPAMIGVLSSSRARPSTHVLARLGAHVAKICLEEPANSHQEWCSR